MIAGAVSMLIYAVLSLIVSAMTSQPLERIKRDQPEYYNSFGMSLSPFSPSRIVFILYLVMGDYRTNVKCTSTVSELEKVRIFAVLQLLSFLMFFLVVFTNWSSH